MTPFRVYWDGPVVPCVRTTSRQKFVDKKYQKYDRFKKAFRLWANTQGFPDDLDLNKSYRMDITFWVMGKSRYDLDNAEKSILDALFKQDRRVLSISARIIERSDKEAAEIFLEETV